MYVYTEWVCLPTNMKNFILFSIVMLFIILCVDINRYSRQTVNEPLSEEKIQDVRAQKIDNYFRERNMPLEGYGKRMVEVAEKNGLDWRLLPAISIRESSGGKQMCKNNPFGWGSCQIIFSSLNEAIDTVGYKLNNLPVYKNKTTKQKLYYYNGTVVTSYPDEVIVIMNKISTTE